MSTHVRRRGGIFVVILLAALFANIPPAAAADESVFAFGDAVFRGSTGTTVLAQPITDIETTPDGEGYWLVTTGGGLFRHGQAPFHGSMGTRNLNAPVVGMASTATGEGYWMTATDGGIFAFGDAAFLGSMGGTPLNQPVVGMAPTPSGQGYWLVASDGGIFAFGDAAFRGSMGGTPLNRPVVGMAPTPSGQGYWLVASDGGIFAFGDAPFHGSTGHLVLNQPVVGMESTPTGDGYWMVARDGGMFAFGDAGFHGSLGGTAVGEPVVGMASSPSGEGYLIATTGRQPTAPRVEGAAYAITDDRGQVGRWDPCRPIRYRINPNGAPAGGSVELINEAVRRVAEATGLDFRFEGLTDVSPGPGHDPATAGADLLIGWVANADYGGGSSISRIHRFVRTAEGPRIEAAEIMLRPDAPARMDFSAGSRASWGWGTRVMFRLANAVGVISIREPHQILSEASSPSTGSEFGADDRRALASVGAGLGCLSGPPENEQ